MRMQDFVCDRKTQKLNARMRVRSCIYYLRRRREERETLRKLGQIKETIKLSSEEIAAERKMSLQ